MTIQVLIKNEDSSRYVQVEVFDFERGCGGGTKTLTEDILPGYTRVYHVYSLRELRVSEKTPETYSAATVGIPVVEKRDER